VSVKGPDIGELDRLSGLVMATMKAAEGVVDVDSSLKAAKPTLDVKVDRGLAGDLGLDVGKIYQALRPLIAGEKVSLWRAPNGENYDVVVRLPERDRATTADLDRITIASSLTNADGTPRMVPLNAVARIEPGQGASQINRRDLAREALVAANVSGRPAGDVGRELTRTLGGIKLPPGYQIVFGGSTKDLAETAGYAATALILGVIFIYLVLASQFGCFLQPLAIMASLPLSLVGVFPRPPGRRHDVEHLLGHRLPDPDGPRDQERDPARRLRQPGAGERAVPDRGPARGRHRPPAADPDDHAGDDFRHAPACTRNGRRLRPARPDGARGDRRPHLFDAAHLGGGAGAADLPQRLQPLGEGALHRARASRAGGVASRSLQCVGRNSGARAR
jgi:hypothetical protein